MRLRGQKVYLLLALFTFGCRDMAGPGPATINARFELQNIDGRPLPTPPAFTPGLTPIINASIVTLDQTGNATITENRTEWNGSPATYTTNYTYKIDGSEIAFELSPPCPIGAFCAGPPKGTFSGNRLSLEMGHVNAAPIIYNYYLFQLPSLPH